MGPKSTDDVEAQNSGNVHDEICEALSVQSKRFRSGSVIAARNAPDLQEDNGAANATKEYAETTRSRMSVGSKRTKDGESPHYISSLSEGERIYTFAQVLSDETEKGVEPWFLEMLTLRRFHFIYLNNKLAELKKRIHEEEEVNEKDFVELPKLLHDQAEAIRDFEYVRSLDFLPEDTMKKRKTQSEALFPEISAGGNGKYAFESRAYRTLRSLNPPPEYDEVRKFLLKFLPVSISWTDKEKDQKRDSYERGYQPIQASKTLDRLARFFVAMAGALFILVPMYVMAIHQDQIKNLITTTVAVVLFAIASSVALRTTNDQTLAATSGYAAVLMVFVGLTTQSGSRS